MFSDGITPILLIVVGLLAILFAWFIGTLNTFNKLIIKVDEAESSIDVALTNRYDLLTKMLAATKGYATHEAKTLEKMVELRTPKHQDPMGEKQQFATQIEEAMAKLRVVVEQYPNLKASENFANLQDAMVKVEENLQAARRVYNANVSYYNQKIVVFPSSLIANWKHFTKKDFFEAEIMKTKDVEINF